ncbi:hypothetical protein CO230_08640 [Chryseobacterium sp. 6424]|uniref:hypothetical protein n=1 Tax=Chryseobacterium sp. 6424 TaxID=2039166 RepID=UPI000EFC8E84|nr:hypothetical protein [Chryseobacterium sp. 6424]AYO58181.1 hypothetical protein CO230_08640 [Chryseobacterium sp. 6424]
MEITVLHNQSLLDIAIQHTGSVMNAFAISAANGLSVSDVLEAGGVLQLPDNIAKNTDILNYYKAKKIQPATAFTQTEKIEQHHGIGWMQIEKTFKVS